MFVLVTVGLNDELPSEGSKMKTKETRSIRPKVRPNRMRVSSEIPAADVLAAIKQKKKVLCGGRRFWGEKLNICSAIPGHVAIFYLFD